MVLNLTNNIHIDTKSLSLKWRKGLIYVWNDFVLFYIN